MHLLITALSFFSLFLVTPILAQTDDSRPRVEQPGIILIQEFPTSQPKLQRFVAYTDQTATGYSGRGFYLVRFEQSPKDTRVPASKVKMILVKPTLPDTILTDADRSNLAAVVARYEQTSKAFPSSASSIMALVDSFSEAINSYDGGSVRVDGKWISKVEHLDHEIQRYDSQLRAEMDAAKSKKDFNYKRNPFYLEIKKLAQSDPYIEERLKKIDADFSAILAREALAGMLAELENPDLPLQKTSEILASISEVKNPSPMVSLLLSQAKNAKEIAASIQATRRSFNAAFAATAPSAELPDLPPDLVAKTQSLMSEVRKFLAGQPPKAIRVPATEARDMVAIAEGLPTLKAALESRNLTAAAELASKLSGNSDSIGGPTKEAFTNIKSECTAKLDRIASLRAEAAALAKGGKKKEAAAKVKEALDISPDPELERQLAELQAS